MDHGVWFKTFKLKMDIESYLEAFSQETKCYVVRNILNGDNVMLKLIFYVRHF